MDKFELSNGVQIPVVGLGTGWMNTSYRRPKYLIKRVLKETVQRVKGEYSKENNYTVSYELNKLRNFPKAVKDSIDIGYSLYDTAYSYNNCALMGDILKNKDRNEYFVISKCSNRNQRQGTVLQEFEDTLRDLQTDYIDLYLIHWPQSGCFVDTWKIFEKLYKEGKVKAIGVSNFNIHHIEEIKEKCEIMPMVNEVECHPCLQQKQLREYCNENVIRLIAHTSTGKMRQNIRESILADISKKYGKSITQVVLRWHYQLGDVAICNSLNRDHMAQNLNIFDFELSEQDMSLIADMDCNGRIWPDPDTVDFTKC